MVAVPVSDGMEATVAAAKMEFLQTSAHLFWAMLSHNGTLASVLLTRTTHRSIAVDRAV